MGGSRARSRTMPHPGPAYEVQPDGRVIERFGEEPTAFYLFGAGHVGRALAVALAPLPFAVTWIDTRPGAIPEVFPPNVTAITHGDAVELLIARTGRRVYRRHDAQPCARPRSGDCGAAGGALRLSSGLIGSATKRARFTSAMLKMGMAAEMVSRLICPIGLTAIKDKAPAAIAASVVAQVLMAREAVRRPVPRLPNRAGRMADTALAVAAPDNRRHRTRCRCSKPPASASFMVTLSPTTTSISRSGPPRCTRCSARTAPANRRW